MNAINSQKSLLTSKKVFIAIIIFIFAGIVLDFYNYKISDNYYYCCRTILDAVVKYKIESKQDEK